MNLYLFSQGITLVLCAFSAVIGTYLVLQIDPKLRFKGLLFIFSASVLFAVAFQWITGWITQSSDELPTTFWLIVLPFTFSINLLIAVPVFRHFFEDTKHKTTPRRRTRIILHGLAAVGVIATLFLSMALLNDYYHFYPTLYSALNIDQRKVAFNNINAQTTLASNQGSQSIYNKHSVEAAIDNTEDAKTDGTLYSLTIPGAKSGFKARSGWVYVPAIATKTLNKLDLPVLVLLPGSPGSPNDWIDGGALVSTLDSFAVNHQGITPLVVVVDDTGSTFNDTECVNSPRGNTETYLTQDVPTYIKSHFTVSANPSNWAIGGISMGGTCGAMLALRHPDIYSTFLDIGGEANIEVGSKAQTIKALFDGSEQTWAAHQPTLLLKSQKFHSISGFFASGRQDTPIVTQGTKELYDLSKQAGLDTVYESTNGGHSFSLFSPDFKTALPWISNRIGATECTTDKCY